MSKMAGRLLPLLLLALWAVMSAQAFVPRVALVARPTAVVDAPPTVLEACRTNAKKEKIKRNRENMRKFATGGRKGLSRRKLLRKAQSTRARQIENEFISKVFITSTGGSDETPKA